MPPHSALEDDRGDPATAAGRLPSPALFLTEPLRGAVTFATLPVLAPWLTLAPRGDGHGVLLLPGLLAGDLSLRPLRAFLGLRGYDVPAWALGRNVGPTRDIMDGMPRMLRELSDRSGGPVSIVGWSLGGIYARELGRDHPDLVRQVITLVSPFALVDANQSRADAAFRARSASHVRSGLPSRAELRRPIPVPSTAVYSHSDGIVDWRACIEPPSDTHQNIAVRSGHLGVGVDASVMWLLADRLAQPLGEWAPFRAPRMLRHCFPDES